LLAALVVNDTPGVDTITVGVTAAGGISVIVNDKQTDYGPGEWDSLLVRNTAGRDTINVRGTVVPSVVHYLDDVNVMVGDAGGVQNVKAALNVNGAVGGPATGGTAAIVINNGADTTPRNVVMTAVGNKEIITGLAPAEISIGVEFEPVGPAGLGPPEDRLSVTTGTAQDQVAIRRLRPRLATTLFNTGGADAIVAGDGTLDSIRSPLVVWGRAVTPFLPGNMTVRLDDSAAKVARQFDLKVETPPGPGGGPGPIPVIGFGGEGMTPQTVSVRAMEVGSVTIDGGSGGNGFVVHDVPMRLEGPGMRLTLNTGEGPDQAAIHASVLGATVVVNGQGGDDTLKAGPIGPWDGVSAELEFAGGGGRNTFIVQGPKASPLDIPSVPVLVTAGRIEHRGVEFKYSGVGKLQLQNGWFNVNEDLGGLDLTVTSEESPIPFESTTSVQINATQNLGALEIQGGPVELSAGGNKVLGCTSLNILGDGTLDLTDNQMEVRYNLFIPLDSIRKWIFGRRLFSSLADARHNLGYSDRSGGIDFAPFGTVFVKYTLYGDANLDGRVDFADLVALAQHYGDNSGNANWDEGDFTYDGKVGFDDLTRLAQNYNTAMAAVAAASPAPVKSLTAPTPRRRPYLRPR
jgi:hypothetical protein